MQIVSLFMEIVSLFLGKKYKKKSIVILLTTEIVQSAVSFKEILLVMELYGLDLN